MNNAGRKQSRTRRAIRQRGGLSIVYIIVVMTVMCAFASFGVDLGRVQLAKTELQRAADAASRHGAHGLSQSPAKARNNAKAAGLDNLVDGTALALENRDISFGRWDSLSRTFTVTSAGNSSVNALRVTARRTSGEGTAIPLMFGSIVGVDSFDLTASAIALYTPPLTVDLAVAASSNPWLAGMPDGTLANPTPSSSAVRRDRAGRYTDSSGVIHPNGESPARLTSIPLVPGAAMTFDAITGTGQHGPTQTIVGPDGNTNSILNNKAGAEHGKSNLWAPVDAVIGVFLDDNVPSGTPPPTLDFSTAASRDFTTLSPALKQVFFIGDGRTSGDVRQQFVVPDGATRLFIGKMDGYEWNNNLGTSTVTVHHPAAVTLVK